MHENDKTTNAQNTSGKGSKIPDKTLDYLKLANELQKKLKKGKDKKP